MLWIEVLAGALREIELLCVIFLGFFVLLDAAILIYLLCKWLIV